LLTNPHAGRFHRGRGWRTPRVDKALIEERLRDAEEFHKQSSREKK